MQLAFPKLYVEPERARKFHESHGGVDRKQIKIWRGDTKFAQGQVRVLIYDGQVCLQLNGAITKLL